MTRMKFFPRLISSLSIGLAVQFLGGCSFSPQPVVQYRATAEGSTWDHGVELHPARTERLDLRTGFLECRREPVRDYAGPRPLFFRVEAANRSNTAVLFDPVDFRIAIPGSDSLFTALDPEAVLYGSRKDMSVEEADYDGKQATAAIENSVSCGIDFLSLFAKETPEAKRDREKAREDARQRQEEDEQRHSEAVHRLSAHEAFWADSVLRKTTLPPGGRLAGRIGFGVPSYGPTPDSLLLQYRERTGAFADLAGYGIVRDSAETRRAKESKPSQAPPGSPLSRYPGGF